MRAGGAGIVRIGRRVRLDTRLTRTFDKREDVVVAADHVMGGGGAPRRKEFSTCTHGWAHESTAHNIRAA